MVTEWYLTTRMVTVTPSRFLSRIGMSSALSVPGRVRRCQRFWVGPTWGFAGFSWICWGTADSDRILKVIKSAQEQSIA